MLKPAILYKDEIDRLFAENLYTERFFYYTGYAGCNELPNIKAQDDYFQFAEVNEGTVTGYFAYHIDAVNDTVDRFGLFSFIPNNIYLIKDVFVSLEHLVKNHRRVEWRVIGGNPVVPNYDRFCKQYGGNKVTLHAVTKDLNGNWRDEHIYEIINKERMFK